MARPSSAVRDLTLPGRGIAVARQEARSVACRAAARPAVHTHAVLAFHTAGRARFEQRGSFTVEAGDVVLVPAGEAHRLVEQEGTSFWGLGLAAPAAFVGDAAALLEPFERVRDGGSAVVSIPAARQDHLVGLFHELAARGAEPAGGALAELAERSLVTLVLDEVRRAAGPPPEAARRPREALAVEALRFLERNCLRRLTLADVAAAVGRSPAHVTTALTRATGRSAVAWLIALRLAEARRLLVHSDERIDAIADRVGYADPTHFIRLFRREHGETPAAFRARARS